MMLVYTNVTVHEARKMLAGGFGDTCSRGEQRGLMVDTIPVEAAEGAEGDVVLVAEVPEAVFGEFEEDESGPGAVHRSAMIPASILNRFCRPRVYGHLAVGACRGELADKIRALEEQGLTAHAREMRDVLGFFDEIGWQTPLRAQGEHRG